MAINTLDYMDICSYCDVATESIQKSIEIGNYDGAHVQLCAYLLEVHSRYRDGEIDADTWKHTLSFYRRMTSTVIEENNLQHQLLNMERED